MEQMDLLPRLLKSNPKSGIPSSSLAQTGRNSCAFLCHSNSTLWIIDSGASDHMTSLSDAFYEYLGLPLLNRPSACTGPPPSPRHVVAQAGLPY